MDTPIAIDIVLLPQEENMHEIIVLNEELQRQSATISHPLDVRSCLPHISLNMCGIRMAALPVLQSHLQKIAGRHPPIYTTGILRTKSLPDGQTISEFAIETIKTTPNPIVELHRSCLALTEGMEIPELPLSAYVQSDDLSAEHTQWTTSFRQSVNTHGYHPHITLNVGNLQREMEMAIICDRIAICQLGNYCTCRKVLMEQALQTKS